MKILFVCNTLYQIIVACCIRKMFQNAEAEMILSDHSTANKSIYDRLMKNTLFFDKVYYVETKHLYDYDRSISKRQKKQILKDKYTVLNMVKLADKYDMFFCANAEPFTERVANYVKKTNKNASLNWFEDGMSAYYYDRCYFPSSKGIVKNKILKFLLGVYPLTTYIDAFYVYRPDKMEWIPKAKLIRIESIDYELAKDLGVLFNLEHCKDKYEEKYIFFEDGIQDWDKATDVKLMNLVADKIGKENILVKIHPRNTTNRFKEFGFKTTIDSSIPWEIIAANLDLSDKILITMYSQSVITPDILMNIKTSVISLGRLGGENEFSRNEIYEFMNRAYFSRDKSHYFVPQNMEEFEEIINNIV